MTLMKPIMLKNERVTRDGSDDTRICLYGRRGRRRRERASSTTVSCIHQLWIPDHHRTVLQVCDSFLLISTAWIKRLLSTNTERQRQRQRQRDTSTTFLNYSAKCYDAACRTDLAENHHRRWCCRSCRANPTRLSPQGSPQSSSPPNECKRRAILVHERSSSPALPPAASPSLTSTSNLYRFSKELKEE
jgi:hypothetical protein